MHGIPIAPLPFLLSCIAIHSSRMTPSVSTLQLLSGIIDAAQHGSSTIRRLSVEARDQPSSIQYKEIGEARSAMTIADTAAQKIIVSSLVKRFPLLRIIGEEDDSVERSDISQAVDLRLDLDLAFARGSPGLPDVPDELDFSDLVVYVDPLDGTREFVEGRLDNVQSLVGVCYRNIPLMGAIGLPFANSTGEVEILYGLVGRGVGKFLVGTDSNMENMELPDFKTYADGDAIMVSTGDSRAGLLLDAIKVVESVFPAMQRQIVGACGNKMIKVMMGESTMAVLHDKTCLWDTCAPSALLSAVGCKVTDFFGEPLVYSTKDLGNKLGIVASAAGADRLHDQVSSAMSRSDIIMSRFK